MKSSPVTSTKTVSAKDTQINILTKELLEAKNGLKAFMEEQDEVNRQLKAANAELASQNYEKELRSAELVVANKELAFQSSEKGKRADELALANKELAYQSSEKGKRADELALANTELAFQSSEKGKRADELVLANTELAFQNSEKGKRATELALANTELAFQNKEKEKRESALLAANAELALQYMEKEKWQAELMKANVALAMQNADKARQTAELLNVNKELEAFAYVSSHDLQEPLRKIRTFASRILASELETLSDTGKNYFGRIESAAERMQTLIQDLLTYSQTNIQERKFEATDLSAIIDDIVDEMGDLFEEKGAMITYSHLGKAQVIPFQFRQLMQNLISNSFKFASPERPLCIAISTTTIVGTKTNTNKLVTGVIYCHLCVSDNGIGFDPLYQNKIFEVFQKLHGKEAYPGTGIGLAIVKKIVDNHNGIIVATGKLDEGATFDIYFPHKTEERG